LQLIRRSTPADQKHDAKEELLMNCGHLPPQISPLTHNIRAPAKRAKAASLNQIARGILFEKANQLGSTCRLSPRVEFILSMPELCTLGSLFLVKRQKWCSLRFISPEYT